MASLAKIDLAQVGYDTRLPENLRAPIDTAAVVLVSRALGGHYRLRAHRLWLSVPDPDGPDPVRLHHRYIAQRADRDRAEALRWNALGRALLIER